MPVLSLPAFFVDDVNTPISAADLNMHRDAAIQLDGLSQRVVGCFDGAAPSAASHAAGDYRVWWGALRFQTGMTTLTLLGTSANFGSATLKAYLDGSGTASATITPSASWSQNITLSGRADGDIIPIEVRTSGNATKTSKHLVTDVYGTPIVVASSWPGVPSFAGTYNAARLNQLTNACQNLWDRITAVPQTPTVALLYADATHKIGTITLYHGAVGRYQSNDILRVWGYVICNNTAETYTIYVNGVAAYTSATLTVGNTYQIYVAIALTHTLGTRVEVQIDATVSDASNQNPYQTQNSHYSFLVLASAADGFGYSAQTPSAAFVGNTSISDTTLNSRLNTIASMLSAVDARLSARPELWNRARASRRLYAQDAHEQAKLKRRYPLYAVRRGDRLVVRGKGVVLGYGATTVPTKDELLDYYNYTFASEQTVVPDDALSTQTIYLDQFAGLFPGTPYALFGTDLVYASEYLSA
jgi:hypothetical protein